MGQAAVKESQSNSFQNRHIGPRSDDVVEMLSVVGVPSLDAMIDKAIPFDIRSNDWFSDCPRSEEDVLAELRKMASKNQIKKSLIGMGYNDTITPPVIMRNMLENPGWYTAYTPYQPEISQGRLEALLNFQQAVCDLTGMELANASLLDEATAGAEAMSMIRRICKHRANCFFVDHECFPQTIAVIKTRANALGIGVKVGNPLTELDPEKIFGVLLQYPGLSGSINDFSAVVKRIHQAGGLVATAADPLSLVLLRPPGEWGADIVLGSTQRFGVPLGFGGPHAAYFATREKYKRFMPGRIIGVSIDQQGNKALRMALQTREQHIRREKATSNVCTAQVLLANIAGMYALWHGPIGLASIANRVLKLTSMLANGLSKLGFTVSNKNWFDTLVVETPSADDVHIRATASDFNLRRIDKNHIGLSLNETTTSDDVIDLLGIISGNINHGCDIEILAKIEKTGISKTLLRSSKILQHPVFNAFHSETGMMRYLRRLEDKDLALNRAMIPLGSCTMKLNAAIEMMPITWPEFSRIHPFAPLEQTKGYRELIDRLEKQLCDITGFFAVSLQPNAGSQGEYSALLAILAYHRDQGEENRNVCLIPSSAHGTNPASAVMANMKVVIVECDSLGNVNLADLKEKVHLHADDLAALMVTYPSTHGVFEKAIKEICEVVHENGGLVFMDGANLQAMVCLCKPGEFGPDVMHMNLHKTFCIPHGGGGPGVGPIGVVERLAPYLPNHPLVYEAGPETGIGAISAAPWGSAGIFPISWTYIELMGAEGLRKASQIAILSANYIAKRLERDGGFNILFKGESGLVAHECIIDTRDLHKTSHISVNDISKRLMDYGFHAPTMSWPVMHTLMVEPTESEPKEELDRFIEAMILIRKEIMKVDSEEWPLSDNPLVNAPHTANMVASDSWPHPYSREVAVFPVKGLVENKYWPAVGRVDNEYGDKNLVCTCPPIDAYITHVKTAAE